MFSPQISRAYHNSGNRPLFLQMLTSLAIGMVMALTYSSGVGSLGFAILALLLLLPWYSTYVYVQKSREVAQQNELLKQANVELETANRALDLRIRSLRALHDIGISVNSAQSLEVILQQVLSAVANLVGADASAVFLDRNGNGNGLSIAGHVGFSDQYVNTPEMALNGAAVRALRERQPLVMDKTNFQPAMLSVAAKREGIRAAASFPLSVDGLGVGGLDVCFKSEHTFTEDELNLLRPLAEEAAVAINNARLTEQIHEGYLSTISALAATVEAKDQYTRGHSEKVRHLAIDTGRQLGLSDREIEILGLGALFHDIGKIGVSDVLLKKSGRLSDEEWESMKEHPVIGEQILRKVPALAEVPRITRHNHERFDGKGYPDGICAREDLLAAVIGVCDAYQAMTSDRPYRKAFTHAHAIEEIRRCSGTHFVPEVAEAFISAAEYQTVRQPKVYQFKPELVLQRQAQQRDGSQ